MEEIGRPPTCGFSVSQSVRDQIILRVSNVIALEQCRVQLPASHHNQPRIMRHRFIVSTARLYYLIWRCRRCSSEWTHREHASVDVQTRRWNICFTAWLRCRESVAFAWGGNCGLRVIANINFCWCAKLCVLLKCLIATDVICNPKSRFNTRHATDGRKFRISASSKQTSDNEVPFDPSKFLVVGDNLKLCRMCHARQHGNGLTQEHQNSHVV
jgi:hypothetical protein